MYLNLQTDFVKLRELKRLQEQMAAVVKEKLSLRALDKFGALIKEWLKKDENNQAGGEGEKDEGVAEAEEKGPADDESGLNKTKMRR